MSAQYVDHTVTFVAAQPAVAKASSKPSVFRRASQWLLEMPRRRAVINELDALSDHELADIGLARADVTRVFDRSFAAKKLGA